MQEDFNLKELKHVCRNILNTFTVLHADNLVHTGMISKITCNLIMLLRKAKDVKSDNIFANLQANTDNRFTDVQLGDLGGCVPADSERATSGTQVGTRRGQLQNSL